MRNLDPPPCSVDIFLQITVKKSAWRQSYTDRNLVFFQEIPLFFSLENKNCFLCKDLVEMGCDKLKIKS